MRHGRWARRHPGRHRHGPPSLRRVLFIGAFVSICATAGTVGMVTSLAWRIDGGAGHRRVEHPDGSVEWCYAEQAPHRPWSPALAICAAVLVVWGITGAFARRATRPLVELADVARRIGEGDLGARPRRHPREIREVKHLGDALTEMAGRIEQQIADQRALLAGASHELRTPLGHLRLLVDTQREQPSAQTLDHIEREVIEMDALVGKLLTQARLDFSVAERRITDVVEIARRALARAALPDGLLRAPPTLVLSVDPTLILGAMTNLLDNAAAHGGGAVALVVEAIEGGARVLVDDAGPGVPAEERAKIFLPFVHRGAAGSLGLGLHLVRRIAEAHGGRVVCEDRDGGGARIGFSVKAA
ncbi:MAG: HAMP domain-containing protein [Deltaproteobacteria bacterium]|nr:HAMP domain-containing protein [Deltaproteobacteria bacterium]